LFPATTKTDNNKPSLLNPTLTRMPEPTNQEEWIDLVSLVESTTYQQGKIVFYFEYKEDETADRTLRYKLRVAIRSVGHKITKLVSYFYPNGNLHMLEIRTTITDKEFDDAIKMYNKWNREVEQLEYEVESESDSDTESESSESTDPI
jgi:hypothetical protein